MKGNHVVRIQCPHVMGLVGNHSLNKEKKKKGRMILKFYGWPMNPADLCIGFLFVKNRSIFWKLQTLSTSPKKHNPLYNMYVLPASRKKYNYGLRATKSG
jgi:hypothetical protein